MSRRARVIAIITIAAIAGLAVVTVLWMALNHRETYSNVSFDQVARVSPDLRPPRRGPVDAVVFDGARLHYWVAGQSSTDTVKTFCRDQGILLVEWVDADQRRSLTQSLEEQKLEPQAFGLAREGECWSGVGGETKLGRVVLYYSPATERLVMSVVPSESGGKR